VPPVSLLAVEGNEGWGRRPFMGRRESLDSMNHSIPVISGVNQNIENPKKKECGTESSVQKEKTTTVSLVKRCYFPFRYQTNSRFAVAV
jgi:hypothetical protein